MNYKSKDSILNFIKLLVIIDITIFILSGLICWFANLRTLNQYINTLFWVGSSKGLSPFFKITKTQSYQQAKMWINSFDNLLK